MLEKSCCGVSWRCDVAMYLLVFLPGTRATEACTYLCGPSFARQATTYHSTHRYGQGRSPAGYLTVERTSPAGKYRITRGYVTTPLRFFEFWPPGPLNASLRYT